MNRFADASTGLRCTLACVLLATTFATPAAAQRSTGAPPALTDAEFWEVFTTRSERGGEFVSENFVSNEMTFQTVIPTLQKSLTPRGVYLGVGPEQNFTYIANLKPGLAIIFDIRRQNAMQHLMFKALFELSPNRAEFVAKLFSRPQFTRTANPTAKVLFDAVTAALPSDSAYQANRRAIMLLLKGRHNFALAPDDSTLLEQVYQTFFRAGPDINYGVRSLAARNTFSPVYPAFGELQEATNGEGVPMGFLANDANYVVVRDMQMANLIVPVVGDFGGPSAIRSVGEFLKKRGLTVTAFYVSNVEQYLYRDRGASDRFYANVAALPFDSTSQLIRSVPPSGGDFTGYLSAPGAFSNSFGAMPNAAAGFGPNSTSFTVSISDSAGVRITRVTRDSAGLPVTRTMRDSTGTGSFTFGPGTVTVLPATDSAMIARMRALAANADSLASQLRGGSAFGATGLAGPMTFGPRVRGANLTVGLSGLRETVDAFFAGRLKTYANAIDMTRLGSAGPRVP